MLTFLAHGSAGQAELPGWTLERVSDAVQRWDGGEHTGVTEEGNWRTGRLIKTLKMALKRMMREEKMT